MTAAGEHVTIGIDVGGSNARVALVAGGRMVAERHLTTGRERGPEAICDDIVRAVDALIDETGSSPAAAGIGVAGQVHPATGVVHYAPNLDWHEFPLRDYLAGRIALPVAVLNDVQAAAYGEWSFGAARRAEHVVALFVGTGVGGGIISGGELVRGCDGSAGELGHVTIDFRGDTCRCGRRGCLEAYAGGWAIAVRAREAVLRRPEDGRRLLELARGHVGDISAQTLATAAAENDPLADELVEQIGVALGTGVASIANALNPCVLVLGGGVIEGMPQLVVIAQRHAREQALAAASRGLSVRTALLNSFGGTVGAAAWARRCIERGA